MPNLELPGPVQFVSINPAMVGNPDLARAVNACNLAMARKAQLLEERQGAEASGKLGFMEKLARYVVFGIIACALWRVIFP
jgi:hypothetical protein